MNRSATSATAPGTARSAQEEAYAHILARIRSGHLPGGAHVTADSISSELGISQIPVREAIRQLASEGFMTIRSNRGAFVAQLSGEEVSELYEMRAVLEGLAIRYTAKSIDRHGLAEGRAALDRLKRARADPEWFVLAHNQFHDLLNAYCPRRRLVAEIVRLRTAAEPYLRMTLRHSPTAYRATVVEHAALLDVVRTRNPDRCEAAIRAHILATDVLTLLPKAGESGERSNKAAQKRESRGGRGA